MGELPAGAVARSVLRGPWDSNAPGLPDGAARDRILPIDATGRRLPDLVSDIRFIEIEGGPHNIGWTHADELNKAFLDFLAD